MFYIYANNNPYKNEKKDLSKEGISKTIDVLLDSGVELSTLFDQDGLLKQLSKRLVEKALESEIDAHLGYNKYARNASENARNGLSSKQIITDNGVISVEAPRDRSSTFEPVLLPKRQTNYVTKQNFLIKNLVFKFYFD